MESLRATWDARTQRERMVLGLGAAVLAFLLLWRFAWEPLAADRERLRSSIGTLRAQSLQFDEDAAEAERLRSVRKERPAPTSTNALLQSAADRAGARSSMKSITEVADGRLQVTFAPLPYTTLVKWIGDVVSTGSIAVDSIQVKPAGTPGSVQVESLVLKVAQP